MLSTERQMGVFTVADVRAAGCVCAEGSTRPRRLGRGTAAVSHGSAARLLGLPVPGGDDEVRLTDPMRSRNGSGFTMVRSPLASSDVVVRGPLRSTTAARTLADCART